MIIFLREKLLEELEPFFLFLKSRLVEALILQYACTAPTQPVSQRCLFSCLVLVSQEKGDLRMDLYVCLTVNCYKEQLKQGLLLRNKHRFS